MQINFFQEDSKFPSSLKKTPFRAVVKLIIKFEYSKSIGYINFIACSDEFLLSVNNKFLNHDFYTDIITFDYSETQIESDTYVSIERIIENAAMNSASSLSECYRVLIHGVLHLAGYKDITDSEKKIMTQKENYYLQLIS